MTEMGIIFILFCLTIFALSVFVINKQQRTIDRLTDKLMAKDYSEYKRYEEPVKTKPEEEQELLSYFDQ